MSLTLISSPVETISGVKQNVFAGFAPVEFEFKREDLAIVSIGSGLNNNIEITIGTDLSSYLEVGDYIYLYAEGASGTYDYDLSAEILAITSSTITINSQYIEGSSTGYINYLKNYYVECELVDIDNVNIKKIPFTLKDDGDNAGNITIDVSIANDKNRQQFLLEKREITEGRIRFNLQYREVYTGVATPNNYILIDDPVILVYATEQPEAEELINDFDLPKLYKGYDSGIILTHSNDNAFDIAIKVFYDELDINQTQIVADQNIGDLSIDEYGFLFFKWNKSLYAGLNADTKFIKFKPDYVALPDYDPADYATPDYKTY